MGERRAVMIRRRSARAILIDDDGYLVLIKRTRPGRTPYWTTAGGGVEFLHDSHWLLRAEALFVDLGSETHTYVVAAPGIGTGTAVANWDDQFWVARLGVAYKFGDPGCCVAPLK